MNTKPLTSAYCLTDGRLALKTRAAQALKKLVKYNPETGSIVWKKRRGSNVVSWNARYAGKECGSKDETGYIITRVRIDERQTTLPAHRLAWFIAYGVLPEGEIDHINGDRSDNRIENLRDVDRSVNCRNAAKRSDNTSGVSGVYWDKRIGAWRASVRADGARHYVGVFHDLSIAKKSVADFRMARGFSERHGT